MTQWRGEGWPKEGEQGSVFTAAEAAGYFHRVLMSLDPDIFEEMQRETTKMMADLEKREE